ncbi:MAG: pyridoxine 4-dehydrogenase [Solirubrobacteraceae bacterium]|jgi:aryl-alcohol dehydrogenase-like predicted oxidoreductase|nr:pyridoxine 4-dehydrogenase [Solirubrobacteraceae bacterium]
MANMTYDLGGRPINRMGFGAMQLPGPGVWGPPKDHAAALAVLRRAVELGVNHVDTAQYYGPDVANDLIREALRAGGSYPDDLRIVTKLGGRRGEDASWLPALAPAELRAGAEDNLRSLGVERLDLVNLRLIEGADVPFEESLGAIADLRDEGKIELIGLSNVGVEQLEAALALAPIAGVQNHYNVLERGEQALFEACARHGLAFTPFFPLGSAFTGGPAKLASNTVLLEIATKHEATPAQIALAWLLHAGDHILLIPGTSSVAHLEENVAAAEIELDADDLASLDAIGG